MSSGRKSTRLANGESKKIEDGSDSEPEKKPVQDRIPLSSKATRAPVRTEDEQEETESLEIIGEDPPLEGGEESIPCRDLHNFYFYDANHDDKLVRIDAMEVEGTNVYGMGRVLPHFQASEEAEVVEEDEDEENEISVDDSEPELEGQAIRLSSIWLWEVEYTACGSCNIWVRTTFAWYRLVYPNPDYGRFFFPILKRFRLVNLVVNASRLDAAITYDQFLRKLPEMGENCLRFPNQAPIKYTSRDMGSNLDFIVDEIHGLVEEGENFDLLEVPLIKHLLVGSQDEYEPENDTRPARSGGRITGGGGGRSTSKITGDKTSAPVFTENVSKLASGFIIHSNEKQYKEEVQEEDEVSQDTTSQALNKMLNFGRPSTSITFNWVGESEGKLKGNSLYSEVEVNSSSKVSLKVGDFIIINDKTNHCNRVIRVCALLQKGGEKSVLGRAFSQGRDTLIGELACYNELFLTDLIKIFPLKSFVGKTKVLHSTIHDDESSFTGYFFRFFYEANTGGYVDASLAIRKGWTNPYLFTGVSKPKLNKDAVKSKTFTYHLYDFVYILPSTKGTPYQIGQIVPGDGYDVDTGSGLWYDRKNSEFTTVNIQFYQRHQKTVSGDLYGTKYVPKKYVPDPRHIYRTTRIKEIDLDKLEGICYVNHKDTIEDLTTYVTLQDTFYVDKTQKVELQVDESSNLLVKLNKEDLKRCERCETERVHRETQIQQVLNEGKPLVALDIFSGCGGLTLGMEKSGMVHTKYSIEFNRGAAITFKKNFPGATVFNQCANFLLNRAVRHHSGLENPPVKDFLGNQLADMPQPGEVDLIYCGPPCQGFSGINRFKKANDIKNSLIATSLSYVEFYRPKYFLLENVRGLLSFKLGGSQNGINRVAGGIKMGYVKFILRCLTYMGYQTRIAVQQAGNFGLAQSRRRVIIWGALMGNKLPDYPQPTTCFLKPGSVNIGLPNGISYVSSNRSDDCAPHYHVSIFEAIADLEGFEYKNPSEIYPASDDPALKEELESGLARFPKFKVQGLPFVGKMRAPYTSEPISEFQRKMRVDASDCFNHVTRPFNSLSVERICRIKMTPGSDHSSLPEKLKPWCLSHKDSAAKRHNGWKGLFGRLDFTSHFLTALTDIQPMGKQGTVIHPSQRRVLTVRECARAQGFPDDFIFSSHTKDDPKDMHRQVGNAVPPPLASALAGELVKALATDFFASTEEEPLATHTTTVDLDEDTFDYALETSFSNLYVTATNHGNQSQPRKRSQRPTTPKSSNRAEGGKITDYLPNLRQRRSNFNFKEDSEFEDDSDDFIGRKVGERKNKFVGIVVPKSKFSYVYRDRVGSSQPEEEVIDSE